MDHLKKIFITDLETNNMPKRFSVKRGFSFFWRSHLVFFVMTLLLLSSLSSWHYDGLSSYIILWFSSELMIILLSMIACLKPKVYKD